VFQQYQIYVKDPNNKLVLCPDAATMRQGGTDICWPIRGELPQPEHPWKLRGLTHVCEWARRISRTHTRTAGLFLGGALAAADKGQMQALGITHILNLVGDGIYDVSERSQHTHPSLPRN
jgi:hypothetical protein